jgi:hypothetical protein
MERVLSKIPLPPTEDQLIALIEASFEKLTGSVLPTEKFISDADSIFVKRYARGGMSSGHISLLFWRCTAIPLLRSRYKMLCQSSPSNASAP